jgi:uncharacterized protein DUF4255
VALSDALSRVSTTLADLLTDRMDRIETITFGPPKADATVSGGPRLNLFLFRIHENPAFRNDEDPRVAVPGTYGHPPLALQLSYLVTSYGGPPVGINGAALTTDSLVDLDAQYILADAMRVLHDVPIVTRGTQRVRSGPHPDQMILDPGLRAEYEALRIAPISLSIDDLSKLWTAFKDEFQRSVAYEVSIVRVETPAARGGGQPVLVRHVAARASAAYAPAISRIDPPALVAAEQATIFGSGLGAMTLLVSDAFGTGFPAQPFAIPVVPDVATGALYFAIPNDPVHFMPGRKSIFARVVDPTTGHAVASEAVELALLPEITNLSISQSAFDGTTVTIKGTLLGRAPTTVVPTDPLIPVVLLGEYPIPRDDTDFSQLAGVAPQITVKLNAVDPALPQPPAAGRTVPVRVRVNGAESRTWTLVNGRPVARTDVQFKVL